MKEILVYEHDAEVNKLSPVRVTFGPGIRSDEHDALLKLSLFVERSGPNFEVIVMMGGEEVGCMEKSLKPNQLPTFQINSEQLLLMQPNMNVHTVVEALLIQVLYQYSELHIQRVDQGTLNIKLQCFNYSSQLHNRNFEIPVSLEVHAQRTGLKVPG